MTRRIVIHLGAGLLGCAAAALVAPALRAYLSPWSAIGEHKIRMFSSDACKTSRRAIELVQADSRLAAFIVPVPADGPEYESPLVCAAALKLLGEQHARVRWLPEALACRWLTEDAFTVVPEGGVPTPSWYAAGEFADGATSAGEAALFGEYGWRIEWPPTGLRLSPLDEPAPKAKAAEPRTIRRIEDLGMSSYRDDRW
ncbi:MAG: hypothetical protein H0T76_19295 [Nannocystis sp.]|nr:hypothetical protein [Nannocystis sp.]MBA3548636.1 hypothetical protein [Nannocystis sp.]